MSLPITSTHVDDPDLPIDTGRRYAEVIVGLADFTWYVIVVELDEHLDYAHAKERALELAWLAPPREGDPEVRWLHVGWIESYCDEDWQQGEGQGGPTYDETGQPPHRAYGRTTGLAGAQ